MRLVIFILIILTECAERPSEFDEYISGIEKMETPITFHSYDYPGTAKYQKYKKDLFRKFGKANSQELQGLVYDKPNFVGLIFNIVGDINMPFLITYDRRGNKIDSLNIFPDAIVTIGREAINHTTLYPDNRIDILSEVKTWNLNASNDDIIEGTEKSKYDSIKLFIDERGYIIKK